MPIKKTKRVQTVFNHLIGKPFLIRLMIPYFVLLMVLAQSDAIIDWNQLSLTLTQLPVWQFSLTVSGLMFIWSFICGRALSPVWKQAALVFLIRQPLSNFHWSLRLLPPVSVALPPIFALAWLSQPERATFGFYFFMVFFAYSMVLISSTHWLKHVKFHLLSLSLLLISLSLSSSLAGFEFAGLIAALVLSVAAANLVRQQRPDSKIIRSGQGLASQSVIILLVKRDLLCIWRTHKRAILYLLLSSAFCSAMILAIRSNGSFSGQSLLHATAILFLLASTSCVELIEQLKKQLGKNVFKQHWPITIRQRIWSIVLTHLALFGSVAIPIALFSPVSITQMLLYGLLSITTVMVFSAVFSFDLLSSASNTGWYMLVLLLMGVLFMSLPSWAFILTSCAFCLISFRVIQRALEKLAQQNEIRGQHAVI